MSNIEAWQYVVALLTPYLVALINRPQWTPTTKRFVMIGVAFVIALVTGALEGAFLPFQWQLVMTYVIFMIGATQAAYTALVAVPATKALLDKTEVVGSGVKPNEAVILKSEVKAGEVQDFARNVGDPAAVPQ